MINRIPIACSICKKVPSEVLLMNCGHNLCLDCAGKRIYYTSKLGQTDLQTVLCEICGTPSVQDPATANRLLAYIPRSPVITRLPSPRLYYPTKPILNPITDNTEYCKTHPGEEVKCYCFTDNLPLLCTECVVEGTHNGHDVQTFTKASPIIQQKLNDAIQRLGTLGEKYNDAIISYKSKKALLDESTVKQNNDIKIIFNDLRNKLDIKEREILQQANLNMDQSQSELRPLEQQLINKSNTISTNIEIMKGEKEISTPYRLVNFYANNKDTVQQFLDLQNQTIIPGREIIDKVDTLQNNEFLNNLQRYAQQVTDSINQIPSSNLCNNKIAPGKQNINLQPSGTPNTQENTGIKPQKLKQTSSP